MPILIYSAYLGYFLLWMSFGSQALTHLSHCAWDGVAWGASDTGLCGSSAQGPAGSRSPGSPGQCPKLIDWDCRPPHPPFIHCRHVHLSLQCSRPAWPWGRDLGQSEMMRPGLGRRCKHGHKYLRSEPKEGRSSEEDMVSSVLVQLGSVWEGGYISSRCFFLFIIFVFLPDLLRGILHITKSIHYKCILQRFLVTLPVAQPSL